MLSESHWFAYIISRSL